MSPDTLTFLDALLARCASYHPTACLTLTAMHPDGKHPTPSRHVPLHDWSVLRQTLEQLEVANRLGWGAFFGVGLRKTGLTRWQRGGADDVVALPALFADVDDPSQAALDRLQNVVPAPSCITFTGGGYHALWWLSTAATNMQHVRRVLHALAVILRGDMLSPAQSLRLVGSCNTKPQRNNALCRIVVLHDLHHSLSDFDGLVQRLTPRRREIPPARTSVRHSPTGSSLNPSLISAVTETLIQQGYRRSGDWLSGPCPYSNCHEHNDLHVSFGFNSRTGYGHCFRCGSMLLKDLCRILDIDPTAHDGLYLVR